MKRLLLIAAALFSLVVTNHSYAQFDFGNLLEHQGRQVLQDVENQIRREVQRELEHLLPPERPPVTTLPWPNPIPIAPPGCTDPEIILPGHPPHVEIIDGGPIYGDPIRNPGNSGKEPQPPTKPLPKVNSGGVVNVSGRTYGKEAGRVFLKIDSLVLQANPLNWAADRVRVRLPHLPMLDPVEATVIVVAADNKIADKVQISLKPAPRPAANQAPARPTVMAGQPLNIRGELGTEMGRVQLRIGSAVLLAKISQWTESRVDFVLPEIALAATEDADVIVFKQDGKVAKKVPVRFAPPKK